MRSLAFVAACVMWLFACSQPPEAVPDDELFDCQLTKDGKFLVCHERKRTEMAGP